MALSPISVLGQFAQSGRQPPPLVVRCALAEAQKLGRYDLVDAIIRTYIEPVVRQHHMAAPAEPAPEYNDAEPSAEQAQAIEHGKQKHQYRSVPVLPDAIFDSDSEDSGVVTVSGKSSPIEGISNDDWSKFVTKLSRESPSYSTNRHVGMFHHRRDRLAELGIADVPDIEAQLKALEADMGDAHEHAQKSGLIEEYVSTTVDVDGTEHPVSLSGLLGVIQAAGLEGACEWLENPSDRKRFPKTTEIFLKTNGVF